MKRWDAGEVVPLVRTRTRWRPFWIGAAVILVMDCGCSFAGREAPPRERALAPDSRVVASDWEDDPSLVGISGAALRGEDEVWVVPERTGTLVSLRVSEGHVSALRSLPISNWPSGTDAESIAFLDRNHVVVGTETQAERDADPLFVVRIDRQRADIESAMVFDYRRFSHRAPSNRGIEGICSESGWVIAAAEAVETRDGHRYARLGVFRHPSRHLEPFRVRLASSEGKLSALACRSHDSGIEVYAIERHYGIMRLVRFVLSRRGSKAPVDAELVVDLAPRLGPEPPNIEGLTWLRPGVLWAVADNHHGSRTGPNLGFEIHLPAPAPQGTGVH